jgi:threonine/homoserine/homoserine lactone efflux protein
MVIDFVKGFLVGLGASIPLGPLGVMCVQKTLSKGRNSGFITGLGAAITDTIFAALAILGLAYIKSFIEDYERGVLLFGGIIVALIGLKIYLTNPVKQIRQKAQGNNKHMEDLFSSIFMTISNPGAIFLILGMFAFVGLDIDSQAANRVITVALAGVFVGASTWWYALSTGINLFRKKFRLRQLLMINRISGIIIIVIGLISFFEGVWRFLAPFLKSINYT